MIKTIFILGRQPELGLAELESFSELDIYKFSSATAYSDKKIEGSFIHRLGGTMKIVDIVGSTNLLDNSKIESFILKNLKDYIINLPEGKINLGISCYGLSVNANQTNRLALGIKKVIRSSGRSIRVVPNNAQELSTAQVQHNKLIAATGVEIVLVANDKELVIGKTVSIQDIEAYAARDQVRPKRDAKVGMLPPKLAQIMINIAHPKRDSLVLDPFCGTGVILQEALLMGFAAYGTDIDERMVEYSESNLNWLNKNFKNLPSWEVEKGDATDHQWTRPIDAVVSEVYLGQPLFNLPTENILKKQAADISQLIEAFLINLAKQTSRGTSLCIAIPAWRTQQGFMTLSILDRLEEVGYNHISFKSINTRELIYNRPQQLVARQLLALIRK